MSHITRDIAHINDELLTENKRLRESQDLDSDLIKDLGRQLMRAHDKIKRLEAELYELRGMQSESNAPSGSSGGSMAGALPRTHARVPMQRTRIGD